MIEANNSRIPSVRPPISVVIPLRNEERTIADLHRRLRLVLPPGSEIVFVDDGSVDRSREVLAGILACDPLAVGLRFLRPFGKSQALSAGFRRSRGEWIATIDADLQEDPEEILSLAAALRGAEPVPPGAAAGAAGAGLDLVNGWRRRRRDPWRKVLGSKLFNALVGFFSDVRLHDINCGLKVMRREVVESIRLDGGFHRFIPLLAHWKGFRVGERVVRHRPRRHGRSRYGKERIAHGLIDLVVLLFLERFESRPSRFFLRAGGFLFLSGSAVCVFLAYLRLAYSSIQSRYPLLALGALLIVVGTQLLSMGLLGELVAHQRRRDGSGADEPITEEIPPLAGSAAAAAAAASPPSATPRAVAPRMTGAAASAAGAAGPERAGDRR